MNNRIRQEQKLTTSLKAMPQIRLEAELLELSLLELENRIQQEIEKNPCLEIQEKGILVEEEIPLDELERAQRILELGGDVPSHYGLEPPEDEIKEIIPEIPYTSFNFWDRVEIQLHFHFQEDTQEFEIARKLIENLDRLGFLAKGVDDLANEMGVLANKVEEVRQYILYSFDPEGICSLDQREFLLVQLDIKGSLDSLLGRIIRESWELLNKSHWHGIQRKYKLKPEEIEELKRQLDHLYAFPVDKYDEISRYEYVYPEVIFKKVGEEIEIELEEKAFPRLRLNKHYLNMLNSDKVDIKTKKFILEQVKKAEEFIRALEKRRENILKTAEFIRDLHLDFFLGKTNHLKPITQIEAAKILNIPVSTLNRVVKNRYAQTPVGIYELKFFFQRGAGGSKNVSLAQIHEFIKEIIENENRNSPYSDEEIRRILKRDYGVILSRRSVVEKRKALNLPNSQERKRAYKLEG